MKEVAIVSAVRTGVGSFLGTLANMHAAEMGAVVIAESLKRIDLDIAKVDEVIMGNVLQAGLGQGPARQAALKAGLPQEAPAWTMNFVCGSGLYSVAVGVQDIMTDEADIVVAGGMENMSLSPYLSPGVRQGLRMGNAQMIDEMIYDGLRCAINDVHMGITAENIAERYGIPGKSRIPLRWPASKRQPGPLNPAALRMRLFPLPLRKRERPFFLKKMSLSGPGLPWKSWRNSSRHLKRMAPLQRETPPVSMTRLLL